MTEVYIPGEKFITAHNPDRQVIYWGCMDDRPPTSDSPALGGRLYRQGGGGLYGLGGLDLAVAMESQKSGGFTDIGKTVHELAVDSDGAFKNAGIYAVIHRHCAAFAGAKVIAQTIANMDDAVFARAQEVKPDISRDDFETIALAQRRIIASGLIRSPEDSQQEFTAGKPLNHRGAIHEAQLVGEHNSVGWLVNYRPGTALDVASAQSEGEGVYHTSMGDLPEVHSATNSFTKVNYELYENVVAVRIGAISTFHLLGPDQKPLPIFRVE